MTRLEDQLRAIEVMDKSDLGDRWAQLTGHQMPKVSTAVLRLAVAWEVQAGALGGLSRSVQRQLEGSGDAKLVSRDMHPGMRLAREHGGTMHVVTIGEAGEIRWKEREWRSLSEVARAITGTRWSGPAFFGLRETRRAS